MEAIIGTPTYLVLARLEKRILNKAYKIAEVKKQWQKQQTKYLQRK